VRESLFGILTPVIDGAEVLDLFAGSGALGLEALSRGARKALFVDNSRQAVRVIEENVSRAGYADRCRIIHADFSQTAKRVAAGERFDLVFVDPPYGQGFPGRVMTFLAESDLAAADGVVALETDKRELPAAVWPGFRLIREKRYGNTVIWLLRREP
jgi:16S rRNA (guanine(966)-N(2))-methyltransferase RsmD